jgi:hypothetical protein
MRLHRLFSFSICILIVFLWACGSLPRGDFGSHIPPPPDYSDHQYWSALPWEKDSADAVPLDIWTDVQDTSPVDVFFIHPTTYTDRKASCEWNADLGDEKLNLKTDKYPIRYQASIFNGVGRVFAPRYRQGHLSCFFSLDEKTDAVKALDLAYEDVRGAFQYYLDHYHQGRPFMIAAHSQGTFHAARLIREMIDGKPLQDRLIVAYIPGLPVAEDYFENIKPCTTYDQTGCFCSWRTVLEGAIPALLHQPGKDIVVTNPVSWNDTIKSTSREEQKGAILRDFKMLRTALVSTKIHEDLLWVSKPRFPGSFLLLRKNYHIADYNFFYADVRQNARDRADAYLRKH